MVIHLQHAAPEVQLVLQIDPVLMTIARVLNPDVLTKGLVEVLTIVQVLQVEMEELTIEETTDVQRAQVAAQEQVRSLWAAI